MVDLPSIGRSTATTDQIQNRLSPADIAAPSRALGAALETGGAIAEDYARAAQAHSYALLSDQARTQAQKLAIDANGDPAAFQKSWDTFSKQIVKKASGATADQFSNDLINIGGNQRRQIVGENYTRSVASAKDAIQAAQEDARQELLALASNGETGTAQFTAARQRYETLTHELTSNPAFGVPAEVTRLADNKLQDDLTGAAYSHELTGIYQKDGYAAAQKRAQEILNDSTDGLDRVRKLKAIREGLSSVKALYTADATTRRQFSADRQQVIAAMADGSLNPDDPLVANMLATADSLNDPVSRMSLVTAQAKARLNPMGGMDLAGRLDFVHGLMTAPQGAADLIRQEEGFRSGAYFDVNAYRTGYGSDTITRADGTIVPVTKDTTVTRADAERDLARRAGQSAAAAAAAVGQDVWNALPAGARSGLTSVTYNYGHLPASVAEAAKSGDVNAIADAVRKLPANPDRRQREAAIIAGGASPLDGYAKGVVPEIRSSIKTALTDALGKADDSLNHDQSLDQSQMNNLIEAARIVDDGPTYDKVEAIFARSATVAAAQGLPVGDQAALVDSLRAPGPVGDEALRLSALDQAQATQKRMADLLDSDPRALGVQLGLFKAGPQVDFAADPATTGAILQSRVPEMQRLATAEKTGPLSVLRPDEAKALTTAWKAGDAKARGTMLATLTQSLPPDTLMATLTQFAGNKDTEPLAVAGALSAVNPEAGAAVLRGLDALKANSKFGFDEGDETDKADRNAYFPTTVMAPSMVTAWQAHMDAAKAVYADASAQAGDATGTFNEERWKAAIDTVTGGFVDFHGDKIIAPAPGVDQRRFDTVMANLPAYALAGATTPDGTPVTMDFVRRNGHLQSYGDGRYVVELGGTGAYAIRQQSFAGEPGGPFVLDLRPYLDPNWRAAPRSSQAQGALDAARAQVRGLGRF